MKVRVPLMVQDQEIAQVKGMPLTEDFVIDGEQFFLDGPVSERVAVLDLDPQTGALRAGTRLVPAPPGKDVAGYAVDAQQVESPDFLRTSAFATVLKTMYMFEEGDTLGRGLSWGFAGPQLLLIPVAGEWANAFYERESRSLQFFSFPSASGQTIYTSLSHDIVSHETGHAILDGIAPDLYHAVTPQSLALHEAVADLTALLMAFRNDTLRRTVLDQTGGSIDRITAFSSVAEQFARARDPERRAGALRQFVNQKTLNPKDTSLDEDGEPNRVERNEPHQLSEVLSGAVYSVMVRIHEVLKQKYAEEDGISPFSASGKALFVGGERLKRMVLRALDYLPPGEVSFADYGRAVLASDQASHPDATQARGWLREEFVRRGIVADENELEVETNFEDPALDGVDLQTLVDSDWAAYDFANRNRELMRIPAGIPFRVRPRLDTSKVYYRRGGVKTSTRECIFKVSWDHVEPNPRGSWLPASRQITVGTTLAIDWESRQVRARLTGGWDDQRADRDLLLEKLERNGVLRPAAQATTPHGRPLRSLVRAEVTGDLMRVRGTARTLHIAPDA